MAAQLSRQTLIYHHEDEANMTGQNQIENRLAELLETIKDVDQRQVGYPTNQIFDYSALIPFLSYSINNVGDPFHQTNYRANTHQFEREVILHFAKLTGLDPDNAWDYVTSGGTEGNMYGLYLARELHPEGMLYFSEEAHYSILKNASVLNMPHTTVKRRNDGEIDYDDLRNMMTVHRDRPAIILASIGTTMRGTVDDIPTIRQIIDELHIEQHYIHADAALSGMILPYVDDPQPFGFDAGIHSISISGHKLIGAPMPCSIVLTRKHLVETLGPGHRTHRRQRYHPVRFPQRHHTAHALVRHQPLRRGPMERNHPRHAQRRRLRRETVQRTRHQRMATPKLSHRCIRPPLAGCQGRRQNVPLGLSTSDRIPD